MHVCEITLCEISYGFFLWLSHKLAPILEEIFIESFFGCIVMVQHVSIERSNFFSILTELHFFAIIFEMDILRQWLIISCKHRAFVLQSFPFDTIFKLFFLPPLPSFLFFFLLFFHSLSWRSSIGSGLHWATFFRFLGFFRLLFFFNGLLLLFFLRTPEIIIIIGHFLSFPLLGLFFLHFLLHLHWKLLIIF